MVKDFEAQDTCPVLFLALNIDILFSFIVY